jgi:hypothetical protein
MLASIAIQATPQNRHIKIFAIRSDLLGLIQCGYFKEDVIFGWFMVLIVFDNVAKKEFTSEV